MDQTLIELETRLAYQEDEIRHLSTTVARQQRELDALREDLAGLKQLIGELAPAQVGPLADEPPPPHY